MELEKKYYETANKETVKKYGQYFTPKIIANFMAKWVSENAQDILDPAVGNAVFFNSIKKYNTTANLFGYEIDQNILNFFNNKYDIEICDYLLSTWDKKYDGIICNPPYNKFQSVDNRKEILAIINKNTNINFSGYTNQALLFLIKSIYQLKENGRLAYIIPTDFLDSQYGNQIKNVLIKNKLLHTLINFECDVFENATTTSCILFLENTKNETIKLINIKNLEELDSQNFNCQKTITYDELFVDEKWSKKFKKEKSHQYSNLVKFSNFANVSRGIATGSNEFFLFDSNKIEKTKIPKNNFDLCISKSADIKNSIFQESNVSDLEKDGKKIFLLNIKNIDDENLNQYILEGESQEINQKYLLKNRKPWYSMEQKNVAPIWITNANRGRIKVVRNLTNSFNLTTFHSIYLNDENKDYTNILFCYLLTDIAQDIIKENKKTMGGGLDKYQPSDLNNAFVLDFNVLSQQDRTTISNIYDKLIVDENPALIDELNDIFRNYLNA